MVDGRIAITRLTKHYRRVRAVDDLSFTVEPGRVTGFLGPNGAGKTTTLRMLVGLVMPTAGDATIGGVRYDQLPEPMRVVGAVLEASSFHKGRTGLNHLRVLCAAGGLPRARAEQMMEIVGLTAAARRKVRGYSLGMRQRLGIAAALLGDPGVLILDEPANGLDPEGIRWLRNLLRRLAGGGRTIFVSSHLLSEVQQLADNVVIIAGGRLVQQGPVDQITGLAQATVRVRTPDPDKLVAALDGAQVVRDPDGALHVAGMEPAAVGRAALSAGVELHELTLDKPDLEQIFLELTRGKAAIQ